VQIIAILALTTISTTPLEHFDASIAMGARMRDRSVIIKLAPGETVENLSARTGELGCLPPDRVSPGRPFFELRCPQAASTRAMISLWSAAPEVSWAEPNFLLVPEYVPNDLNEEQWYHQNVGQVVYPTHPTYRLEGIADADIDTVEAWDLTTGDPNVVMALVDSGLDLDHPEFAGRFWVNEDEDCTNGIDDDGNNYIDDCNGWDTGDGDNDPSTAGLIEGPFCDPTHGTNVAGVMAATGNNSVDIAGINWGSRIMVVKESISMPGGCDHSIAAVAEGYLYAIDNGANVVNCSLGGTPQRSMLWDEVAREADAKGVLLVMSGGNDGVSRDLNPEYPIAIDFANKLAVANTTNRDELWAGANQPSAWGTSLDLAAPGYVIRTIQPAPDRSLGRGLGTSLSAPQVTGTVGLILSLVPELNVAELKQAVLEGADVVGSLDCANVERCVAGGRRLNVHGALLRALELANFEVQLAITGATKPSDTGTVTVSYEVMNTGTAALRKVQATLTASASSALAIVRGDAALGDVAAGDSVVSRQLSAFVVSVPSTCGGTTAFPVQVELKDERGPAWVIDTAVTVECQTPDLPGPKDPDPTVEDDQGGCACNQSRGEGGSAIALAALLLLGALRRRNGNKRAANV
jgi:subtilisin family serine protease